MEKLCFQCWYKDFETCELRKKLTGIMDNVTLTPDERNSEIQATRIEAEKVHCTSMKELFPNVGDPSNG